MRTRGLFSSPSHHLIFIALPHFHCITSFSLHHLILIASPHSLRITSLSLHHLIFIASPQFQCITSFSMHHLILIASPHFIASPHYHCITSFSLHHLILIASPHSHCITSFSMHHLILIASPHSHCITSFYSTWEGMNQHASRRCIQPSSAQANHLGSSLSHYLSDRIATFHIIYLSDLIVIPTTVQVARGLHKHHGAQMHDPGNSLSHHFSVGLARTIHPRCIYGIFCREITKYMVIYGVYIRFWPTLRIIYR